MIPETNEGGRGCNRPPGEPGVGRDSAEGMPPE